VVHFKINRCRSGFSTGMVNGEGDDADYPISSLSRQPFGVNLDADRELDSNRLPNQTGMNASVHA